MHRRSLLLATAALPFAKPALAADMPGVTDKSIKIGNTMPYSGPASAYGAIGRGLVAYFKMVNDAGGINGRTIEFETLDDGYVGARTVEQSRRLIEQDGVAFLLCVLGTAPNSAIQKYMNSRKVPQLFSSTGADKWGDYKNFPWTMGWQPSYRTEAQIYTKYLLAQTKEPKLGIIYQNDDFGKDYLAGVKDVLGDKFDSVVVKMVSYEVTDPTVDSQVITLQGSGATALLTAATPKFAAQTIRKVYDIGWKPMHFMTNVSASVGAVITPAGPEKAVGIISGGYQKDWTDAKWHDDPGMKEWHAFMQKYMADSDLTDLNYPFAYGNGVTIRHVLTQCGNDLSRENIMKQATSIKDLEVPTLLPGIKVNTSPTNYHPIRQMQLMKWSGKTWEMFGEVLSGANA